MEITDTNENNICLICDGKKIHYNFSIEKYRVEECVDCGLMRLNPQPSDSELAKIYGANYFAFSDDKSDVDDQTHAAMLKSGTADHYLDLFESYIGSPLSGRLLEIGCGHGDFLARAAARGLSVSGVEYSKNATEIANKKLGENGHVYCGEIQQLCDLNESFDYIIFADVLEHVRDPRKFLKQTYSLLKKDGVIAVIVPSLDSFSARLMKNRWVEFKPEHLWYFSLTTLRQLLYSEDFGELEAKKAKKTLSFDYIAQHFDHYPVPPYSTIIQMLRRFLPRFIKRLPIRVVASGVIMFARKKEIQPVKTLSVVLPAYNEEKTIKNVIDQVLAKKISNLEIELIIVESKSSDNTQEIVRAYEGQNRVKVIWQNQALGKGNAVQAGLKHINGDFVLIQDADNEYDIEDYNVLVEPLIAGEATFVLGARHGGRAWKMRKFEKQRIAGHLLNFGHWFFTTLINIIFKLRLKDPFTMYKVFRADCLRGLKFDSNRFDFDFELLIKLVRKGYKPIEIPVNYRSRSFKEGKKVRVLRDPWTWLWAILKYRFQKV